MRYFKYIDTNKPNFMYFKSLDTNKSCLTDKKKNVTKCRQGRCGKNELELKEVKRHLLYSAVETFTGRNGQFSLQ